MEWQPVIELLTSILASFGIITRARKKIVEEIQLEIVARLQPVLDKFEASEKRQKEQVDRLNDTFHMIYDVMQMAGQDDAEKYRLLVMAIERQDQTLEEILVKLKKLETEIHHE